MSNLLSSRAFVVIAEFQVKPGVMPAFLDAAREDAAQSMAKEQGCRQFDIIQPETPGNTVLFYEVYDSREAFNEHLKTPHLARFRKAFPPLVVAEKPVRFADRCYPG